MTSDKKTYDIRAKSVIVSAGTWETPRLLLSSGIPGRAIGHYLVNHPKVFANAKTGRGQFSEVSGIASLMIPNPDNNRLLITGIGTNPVWSNPWHSQFVCGGQQRCPSYRSGESNFNDSSFGDSYS